MPILKHSLVLGFQDPLIYGVPGEDAASEGIIPIEALFERGDRPWLCFADVVEQGAPVTVRRVYSERADGSRLLGIFVGGHEVITGDWCVESDEMKL